MISMATYSQFYDAVRENVKQRVARFGEPEAVVDEFLKAEEEQIKGEYRHYTEDGVPDGMTPEAFLKSCIESISYCLEMCF